MITGTIVAVQCRFLEVSNISLLISCVKTFGAESCECAETKPLSGFGRNVAYNVGVHDTINSANFGTITYGCGYGGESNVGLLGWRFGLVVTRWPRST